jgi:hypothetical protein
MQLMDQPLHPASLRRGVTRAGLILAVTVLAVFAVVVLVFVARTPSKATGTPATATSGPAPDIKQLPQPGSTLSGVNAGGRFFAQMVAKDDPTRLTGEITAERYEPLADQRFKLEKPDGWAFLRNGRTVHLRADTGRTYMPDQSAGARPRDAVLNGHVEIRFFEARPDGKRPNLSTDAPFAIITSEELKYDGELGQVRLPPHFEIVSDAADMTGTDLTVLFDDVDQRLEWMHAAHVDRLVVKPTYKPGGSPAPTAPSPAPATQPGELAAAPNAQSATPARPPNPKTAASTALTFYHVTCETNVRVEQSGRTIDADKLDGWARLEGNTLRPGAIVGWNGKEAAKPAAPLSQTGQLQAAAPAVAPTKAADDQPSDAGAKPQTGQVFQSFDEKNPVTITWDGPMDVRPLTEAPGELTYNDVFVRFTSEAESGVRFADPHNGATATGTLLEYGATRRDVALASSQPMTAVITFPGSGVARGQRWEMNLTSGAAHANGRGEIVAEKGAVLPSITNDKPTDDPGPTLPRSLSWNDQADFRFVMNDKHEVTQAISEVRANGAATATDGKSSLAGASLIALFTPVSEKASRVQSLQLAGGAYGEDGQGGKLSSDTLDVTFVPTPGKPEQSDPDVVTARGDVRAQQPKATLASDYLQAHLVRSDESKLVASKVNARDRVVFENTDGVRATAAELEADPIARTARLTGPEVRVSKETTTITGTDVTLWDQEQQRRMKVTGAGTIEHDGPLDDSKEPKADKPKGHAHVSWSHEMTFEDLTGEATCKGDVESIVTKPARPNDQVGEERDTMHADNVHLTFTPAPARKTGADPILPTEEPSAQRRLLTVECVGTLADRADGEAATVESRRLSAAPPAAGQEPQVEQLLYLKSARIKADNQKSTLDAPTPGTMLVLDSRAAAEKPANDKAKNKSAAMPFDTSAGAQGTTEFTWRGSMSMDREKGEVHFNEGVGLVHKDQAKGDITQLDCEKLIAHIRETPAKPSKPGGAGAVGVESFSGELVSADATEAVWMRSGSHQLIADSLHYDAIKKLITAKATGPGPLQVFDAAADGKGTPSMTAREIMWDLDKDRIDVTRPEPIVSPR